MPVPIQNLRSNVANKRPVATGLAAGQFAVNFNETDPAIYLRGHADALVKVAPVYVGTTAPNATPASGGASGNTIGEQWLDKSVSPPIQKIWDGTTWVAAYSLASGTTIESPIINSPTATGGTYSGGTFTSVALNNATASGGVYTNIALSGTPTAPTQVVGTSGTSIATTAFVNAEIANDAPAKNGTGATGTWPISVSGNAATATSFAYPHTVTITGAVSTSFTISGGGISQLISATSTNGLFATPTLSGATITGSTTVSSGSTFDVGGSYRSSIVSVAASDINCTFGNYFVRTVNGNVTFTFSNAPASRAYAFTLEIIHTTGAITWPGTVAWPKDTAPTLTTGRTHLFIFVTDDGGNRWRGASLVDYVN